MKSLLEQSFVLSKESMTRTVLLNFMAVYLDGNVSSFIKLDFTNVSDKDMLVTVIMALTSRQEIV